MTILSTLEPTTLDETLSLCHIKNEKPEVSKSKVYNLITHNLFLCP